MGHCQLCGTRHPLISDQLGVCLSCIYDKPEEALRISDKVHENSRRVFGLPFKPPQDPNGLSCGMCANDCRIGVGGKGFCALVFNIDGELVRMGGTPDKGVLEWYYDPLPTNCVAYWFCPGCTGAGYPRYAYQKGPEVGYYNLAVFYGTCSYDCLFCQNWHYRHMASSSQPTMGAQSLAEKANSRVSCICYFGGDPSSQMPHALKTSQLAIQEAELDKRILRICWETNGYEKREFALSAAELSLKTGGNLKFDLKAWSEDVNVALCNVSNKPTLRTFKLLGERFFEKRPELPILTASTLLVPGYVDIEEVSRLSAFIAQVNPEIPYTLLAFYPQYVMDDLPTTSRKQANLCCEAAKKHLEHVRIGNTNLLS